MAAPTPHAQSVPEQPSPAASGFNNLGIAEKLLSIISKLGFTIPTPIQTKCIPIGVEGQDIVGIAQTGTGKTLAFAIPMLQRLAVHKGKGLILLPTRELALQVDETLQQIGRGLGIRTAILIGGAAMGPQLGAIRRDPHIIVATPGRLLDHMEQKTLRLDAVKVLILDEADRMLDMGFAPQINRILAEVPKERQTMLFSATMPEQITKIAVKHMKTPLRVEIAPAGTVAERVAQELYVVARHDKLRLLDHILAQYAGTVLVFSRTKHGAKKMAHMVKAMGHAAAEIHSNRSLAQRKEALQGFKSGKYRVLIATDIAARGIDVTGIELVVNFDLPDQPEDYVHRIGRTGRAGLSGKAISFATPDQGKDVRQIERLARVYLPVTKLPALPAARNTPLPVERPERGDRRGGFDGGRGGFGGGRGRDSRESGRRGPGFGGQRRRSGSSYSDAAGYGSRPAPRGRDAGRSAGARGPKRSGAGAPVNGRSKRDASRDEPPQAPYHTVWA